MCGNTIQPEGVTMHALFERCSWVHLTSAEHCGSAKCSRAGVLGEHCSYAPYAPRPPDQNAAGAAAPLPSAAPQTSAQAVTPPGWFSGLCHWLMCRSSTPTWFQVTCLTGGSSASSGGSMQVVVDIRQYFPSL
jgi:hypothetical protein